VGVSSVTAVAAVALLPKIVSAQNDVAGKYIGTFNGQASSCDVYPKDRPTLITCDETLKDGTRIRYALDNGRLGNISYFSSDNKLIKQCVIVPDPSRYSSTQNPNPTIRIVGEKDSIATNASSRADQIMRTVIKDINKEKGL
jgi:hypothetical protein